MYQVVDTFPGLINALHLTETTTNLFLPSDGEDLRQRIKRTRALAIDFDGTASLTTSHPYGLDRFLPAEVAAREQERRKLYTGLDLHNDDERWDVLESGWVTQAVETWVQAQLEEHHFVSAGQACSLRPGVDDLFALFEKRIVISFGFVDIIRHALVAHGLKSEIGAMLLDFVEGRLTGGHGQIMTTARKHDHLQGFCGRHGLERGHVIAVGDTFGDRKLFRYGGVSVFMIPLTDGGELDLKPSRRKALELLWPYIDIVTTGDFSLLVQLLKEVRAS